MASKKTSELDAAAALTGTELVEVVQGGDSVRSTVAAFLATLDADLLAIGALTSAADKGIHATGAGTWAVHDLTAFARTLLDDPDASTFLTTLGISTFVKTLLDDTDAAAARRTLELINHGRPKISGGAVQYGIPGVVFIAVASTVTLLNFNYYTRFVVTEPITIDQFSFEVTSGPASDATVYVAIYAADADLQPTGAPLLAHAGVAVATAFTGVKDTSVSVPLTPGVYLAALNTSVTMTLRTPTSGSIGIIPTMAGTPFITHATVARPAAAFGNPGAPWTSVSNGSTGQLNKIVFRW